MKNYNEVNLNYIRDILEFIDKKETVSGRRYFGDLANINKPEWVGKEFIDCIFINMSFTNIVMDHCIFLNCTFNSCETAYAKAIGCEFKGCTFNDTNWFPSINLVRNIYENTTDYLGLNSNWDNNERINFLIEMMSGGYHREVNSKALNKLIKLCREEGRTGVISINNVEFLANDILMNDVVNLEFNYCDFRKLKLCARKIDNITFKNCCTWDLSIVAENASNITVQNSVGSLIVEADNLTNFTHDGGVVSKAEKVKFTIDCPMVEEFNVRQTV